MQRALTVQNTFSLRELSLKFTELVHLAQQYHKQKMMFKEDLCILSFREVIQSLLLHLEIQTGT